jgi:hypothetical protein
MIALRRSAWTRPELPLWVLDSAPLIGQLLGCEVSNRTAISVGGWARFRTEMTTDGGGRGCVVPPRAHFGARPCIGDGYVPTRRMTAEQTFQKALLLLDRGLHDRGLGALEAAVEQAAGESDDVTLAAARCVLGELLLGQGRTDEARQFLELVAETRRRDDLLDYEIERARTLLAELGRR